VIVDLKNLTKQNKDIEEIIRLLYVAFTRAKEEIYILGSEKLDFKKLDKIASNIKNIEDLTNM
jgi:ATP-dependent exoDNAse (exonuclease V) beta subunit